MIILLIVASTAGGIIAQPYLYPKPTPISFFDTHSSYYKQWRCKGMENCSIYIYLDKSKSKTGVKYQIPPNIMKKLIKDYMKQSKTLYS
jgi:hypothetical protein